MKSRFLLFLLIILISCNTNNEPEWITSPPEDDALYLYLVVFSEDSNPGNSITTALVERFGFNFDILQIIVNSLLTNSENEIKIIDNWDSGDGFYSLVRIERAFIDSLRESIVQNYEITSSFIDDYERNGDLNLEKGEIYNAYSLYIASLEELLNNYSHDSIPGIIRVMDKLDSILSILTIADVELVKDRIVGVPFYFVGEEEPVGSLKLIYNRDKSLSFKGFRFSLDYLSPDREFSIVLASEREAMVFTPPIPEVSGEYIIGAEINLDSLKLLLEKYSKGVVGSYAASLSTKVDGVVNSSKIENSYSAKVVVRREPLLIMFEPEIIGEGVARRLLEDDITTNFLPEIEEGYTREHFLREVHTLTGGKYRYMVTGDNFNEERVGSDGDVIQKLNGSYSIVDLKYDRVVYKGDISSEFILDPQEEALAFLDLGLVIGESLVSLEF